MKPIPAAKFIPWLSRHGLAYTEQTGRIKFNKTREAQSRFWCLPESPRGIAFLLGAILDALDPWSHVLICKHQFSKWCLFEGGDGGRGACGAVHDRIVMSAGIPRSFSGALRFEKRETDKAITLLFNQLVFGCYVWDDVYLIPDHAQQIVDTSHHDVVGVAFANSRKVAPLVRKLAKEEFHLPGEVPDETFKVPDWMKARKKA